MTDAGSVLSGTNFPVSEPDVEMARSPGDGPAVVPATVMPVLAPDASIPGGVGPMAVPPAAGGTAVPAVPLGSTPDCAVADATPS